MSRPKLSFTRLILSGLRYHWRSHLAVALAVAAATAVLTGALIVGDSMRGSLRHLLLDQLGSIDDILSTDRFFRTALADELAREPGFRQHFRQAVPAIVAQGSVENPRQQGALRANQVTVIGCDARFWQLGSSGPAKSPGKGEIVLNQRLADEIGAKVGDEVLVRIGSISQIPPDSALGRKTETVRNRRLRVIEIIPTAGLGRLALHPSQLLPSDAFVATETLQDALDQPARVNALFVAGDGAAPTVQDDETLQQALRPTLADYGLQLDEHPPGYVQWTSNRMLLDPAVVTAIERDFAAERPQPVFTYLANTIAGGGHEIPYSTITAIDFSDTPPLGPFKTPDGQTIAPLADDEIALNTWAAEDLGVKVGDPIEIVYFEPESTHAQVREARATFRLKAIVALDGSAADPELTPQLPGVTDQVSMSDWDAPFPFDPARVRKKDEKYWDDYRTTPKAFVSLAAGRRMWSSRFGNTTSLRFAPEGKNVASMAERLRLKPESLGFTFMPVKRLGLAAAGGTTPFDWMFVGFSLFIMVSTLTLVSLLFRLGLDGRAAEIGLLRAVGFGRRQVARVLSTEGLIVAACGALLGTVAGAGYAWLMLAGLRTWWLSAIRTPFLSLYITPRSLAIGFAAGVLISQITILLSLRRLGPVPVRRLLAGQTSTPLARWGQPTRRGALAALAMIVAALALGLTASRLGGEAQAGAFVTSGLLVMIASLVWVWNRLQSRTTMSLTRPNRWPIARLALRNAARNPGRSTLSIGLVAAASFLIVALSAFRLDPQTESGGRDSGSGGFNLVASADLPIYQDLNSTIGREEAGFSAASESALRDTTILPLRVQAGDDASCLNLYQATKPRVLGVTSRLIERGGFQWAMSAATSPEQKENPWLLLDATLPAADDGRPVIPVVLDYNTAMFSLHKGQLGDTLDMEDGRGRAVRLQIVGMLKNSLFQGDLLISERAFLEHFPDVSGYRFFLIDTPAANLTAAESAMEDALGDYGFDAQSSQQRLADFFAVQNTYLSTFQSLGGLGLLLGTFGLAAVQLRSIVERRAELALLRAEGFRRGLLARMVMIENSLLLIGGLAIGVIAAIVAVAPHWLSGGAAVPWQSLTITLLIVLTVGLLAGLTAVRAVLRAPLLPALRAE